MAEIPDPADPPARDDVDPDVRRFHRLVSAGFARHRDFDRLPRPDARRIAEEVRRPWTRGGPVMRVTEELQLGELGTRVRVHRPTETSALPTLIYLHGGGWTLFSLDTHDRVMREYAARAGVAVVGVDYSLSPEHRFPRALDECVAVVAALRRGDGGAGIDIGRLAIGGDSAGANLAVATNLSLRAAGTPVLSAMLLNYGAYDRAHTESYRRFDGERYMLTADEMDGFWRNYLGAEFELAGPLACPLQADLRGLPSAFLAIAECDILADQSRLMADRLRAAGVRVESHVYRGATHSFLESVSISALANRAFDDAAQWLRMTLAPPDAHGRPV
jgi:acetyl esterase